jgi:cytochrome c peroxidase
MNRTIVALLCALSLAWGCSPRQAHDEDEEAWDEEEASVEGGREPIAPLEPPEGLDPARVELGGKLFHDKRLSGDGSLACASCHPVAAGGEDGLARSPGAGGAMGGINTPTVLNSGLSFAQFWDGRAASLEAQAEGPLLAPVEMASSWERALAVIKSDPEYVRAFQGVFPDGATRENVLASIAAFERSLVTTGGRFDAWLRGDKGALSAEEVEGYQLFKAVGCVACHQGQGVGGNMYQRFGIAGNYMEERGGLTDADLGRFVLTQKEEDRYVFKVPSLRNIERTAPYLHDGSVQTLEEAVQIMGRYQLGRPLSEREVALLVAFLKTLSGDIPDVSRFETWAAARAEKKS